MGERYNHPAAKVPRPAPAPGTRTNRRAAGRVERALAATERLRADAERTLADPVAAPADRAGAGRRLAAALVEPREAQDAAVGEWWQRDLPEQQVLAAE
ncbi:hypothetical protein [Streptomyces xantholiticus]